MSTATTGAAQAAARPRRRWFTKALGLVIAVVAVVTLYPGRADAGSGYVRAPNTVCYVSYANWYGDSRIVPGGNLSQAYNERRHTARINAGNNPNCKSVSIRMTYVYGWGYLTSRTDRSGYLYVGLSVGLRNRNPVRITYTACDKYDRCGSFNRYHW